MAITIVNQWPGTAADQDCEVIASPTPGRVLIAPIVTCVIDGSSPTLAIGDVSRNGWALLADPIQFASVPHVAGQLQVEIWACPSARFDGWPFQFIYASAMQITAPDVGALCTNVLEVNGMAGQVTVDSVTTGTATNSGTIAMTAPAPTGGANVIQIAAAASNIAYGSYTTTGTGWTQLSNVTKTNPELGLMHAWREATTGGAVTFGLLGGALRNWAGVIVALKTAGTVLAQPNPAWPPTNFQVGFGYDLSTPLSRVRWTDQTTRYRALDADRGFQAELGVATQGTASAGIRNDDGAYTPRAVASGASATAAGTTTTIKVADASATNMHVTDYFRLTTAAGVLKQLDTFQVTGLSSTAGTTTVTFTRADGTAAGALAATATGDVYAGIQIDLYIPWRLVKTVAGTPYTTASGWLKDLPISFTDAHWSQVTAAGADALEVLSVAGNPSALQGELYRRRALYAYWPLNDTSGAGYAANASGVSNAALTQTVSKYGAGASTAADFGAATQDIRDGSGTGRKSSLLGDPGTGWAQDGQTAAEMATKGYALVGNDRGMPSITGGVTIIGAIEINDLQLTAISAATSDPTIVILRNSDPAAGVGQGSIIKVSIARSGPAWPIVTRWDKSTHATTATTCTTGTSVGGAWGMWALVFDQTSWAVYADGVLAGSGSCNLVPSWSGIDIGGEADAFNHGRTFPATHAHIAVYGRKLTGGEIGRINDSAAFGYFQAAGETVSARIQKKLAYAAWKNTRVLNPGQANVAAETAPSGSVSDLASDVAGYEDSLWFTDAASQAQYRNRITAYQQFPRATLGEDTAGGEIPYQPGQLFDYNPTFIYNDVEVENTRAGGYTQLASTTVVAVDDVSAARYGTRILAQATRYADDYNAWNITWWLLAKYAYPQLRVGTVVVSAAATADPARWALVCGVEIGDLVTVKRRPIGQPAITVRCRVLRVQPSFNRQGDPAVAQVTLTLGAAPPKVPIANDPVYGVIGGTVLGA
jgi:hypothetical protein